MHRMAEMADGRWQMADGRWQMADDGRDRSGKSRMVQGDQEV
jgi:hypothetical protein